jgi:nucleoid-associated protein YgaU
MTQGSRKIAIALLIFVGVWVGVYWSLSPRPTSQVTFADDLSTSPGGGIGSAEGAGAGAGALTVLEPATSLPTGGSTLNAEATSTESGADAASKGAGAAAAVQPPIEASGVPVAPVAPAPRQPAVIPPVFEEYTIQQGDTLPTISRRFYGTPNYASAISRANPLMNPAKLRPGRPIKIPKDPTNIQGKPNAAYVKPKPPGSVVPVPAKGGEAGKAAVEVKEAGAERPVVGGGAKPAAAAREYEVRSGDSLSRISKLRSGDGRYATLIFEANKDALASPDAIKVGQKLKIPPKPAD